MVMKTRALKKDDHTLSSKVRKTRPSKTGTRPIRRRAGFHAVSPESLGLCSKPLKKLRAATKKETDELKCMAGAAHIVLYRGKCVFTCSQGWSDVRRRVRFSLDTICKLHGCTKPLVAAAFLTLVESGKVRLNDPVSKYIRFPECVAAGGRRASKPASRTATLRNLMTMTAGLGYESHTAYQSLMKKVHQGKINTLADFCESITGVPLMANPGTRYEYSFATDVLGYVCEVVSGTSLDKFVEQSILKPMGMSDTHFIVPARKQRRVAVLYHAKPVTRKTGSTKTPFSLRPWSGERSPPGILSAGGGILSYEDPGMMSTARDYAQFCQMLLGGGLAPNGRRILQTATVKSLWKDALAAYGRADGRLRGWHDSDGPGTLGGDWDYTGINLLHTHLVFDKAPFASKHPRQGHSMWMGGGGGTCWSIDAKRELVSITFTQFLGGRQSDEDGMGPFGNDASPFALQAVDGFVTDGE
mmetsp:Transcript_62084/g.110753  ORF Transcript_62084/g.110753 Transcript_62084/m.110753 type:complete len:471 (-) Transcript_62084:53-1465(-)